MPRGLARHEWGFQPSSGRDKRKTSRRWGSGRRPQSAAERMRRMRSRKSPQQLKIDSAVLVARRAIRAGRLPAPGKLKFKLFKKGQKVRYCPLGFDHMFLWGTIEMVYESAGNSKSAISSKLVVVRRALGDRKRDRRLAPFVAVPPSNIS